MKHFFMWIEIKDEIYCKIFLKSEIRWNEPNEPILPSKIGMLSVCINQCLYAIYTNLVIKV